MLGWFKYFRFQKLGRSLRHPVSAYKVRKAKKKYRKEHPCCAVCGLKRNIINGWGNDVHHKTPVHVLPDEACNPENLITLCRTHHFVIGHLGNWKAWNSKIAIEASFLKIHIEGLKKWRCP